MSTLQNNAASLLGLAFETRFQIYEELLEDSDSFHGYTDFFKYRVPINLLLVNKQIREEAEPILFRKNALVHHVYALPVRKDTDCIKEPHGVKDSQEVEDFSDNGQSYNFDDSYEIEDFPFAALCPSLGTVHLRLLVPANFDVGIAPDMLMATLAARMRKSCEVLSNVPALRTVEVSILGGHGLQIYDFNFVGRTHRAQERLIKLYSRFAYMLFELQYLPITVTVKRGYVVFYKYHDKLVGEDRNVPSPVNDKFTKCLNAIMALRPTSSLQNR